MIRFGPVVKRQAGKQTGPEFESASGDLSLQKFAYFMGTVWSPYLSSEFRNCVKVEVAVRGCPS